MINGVSTNLSAAALSAMADSKIDESLKEDNKLNRSRRAAAMDNHIKAAREKIKTEKAAADERLEAAKDKASGSFWGALLGAILMAVLIVAAIVCCIVPGAQVAVPFLLLGAGAAAGLSPALGSAIGAKNAEDNEEKADELKELADNMNVDEKALDKRTEDLKDQIKAGEQQLDTLYQDKRKREADRNGVSLRG